MRILFSLVLFALTSLNLLAEDTKTNAPAKSDAAPVKITAAEAKSHVGAAALVTGTIVEVNRAEKLTRINLDEPFPKTPFTAVIFGTRTNSFGDLEKLKGKKVEVKGKITAFRDRPQIILTETNQLRLVEGADSSKAGKE